MHGHADILGHRRALATLWQALERDALHHAYLFEGPRGVGKLTVALRLAMAANCTGDTTALPCGVCDTCRQIAAGSHPDVMRVAADPDKATATIAVDAVREIVRKTGYHRYGGKRRFILVDPAEAMAAPAANALLKTLEEPPEGTGFVLVTHNASALLPTILSRCQRVRFGAVPEAEVTAWLAERGHAEQAQLAARLGQGCPGRALALVEGGLERRLALRDRLLEVLGGRLTDIFDWSGELTQGKRQEWRDDVEALLEVIEDLLRDVVILGASDSSGDLLNADRPEIVERWRRALWPGGVSVCARAVGDLREELLVNVTGKTSLDALLTRLATELGPFRR